MVQINLPPDPKECGAVYSYKYKNNGNPTLKNTSYIVLSIILEVDRILTGEESQGYLDKLCYDELKNVLEFCAARKCVEWKEHCGGCELRRVQDGTENADDFVNRFETVRFTDSDIELLGAGEGKYLAFGTLSDLLNDWRGIKGWEIASKLLSSDFQVKLERYFSSKIS